MVSMEDLNSTNTYVKNPSAGRRRRHSEGLSEYSTSDSDSDLSRNSGSVILESEALSRYRRRRNHRRRESAASVSTSPDEEVYVMVLQNKTTSSDDIRSMSSLKNKYDVTFLVGEEKKHVHGLRAVIAERSCFLQQLMLSFEKNRKEIKQNGKSKMRKTFAKLRKLTHNSSRRHPPLSRHQLVIPMETFDAEAFQRLMTYIHCGTLTVDASTVIGLMNAAYMFEFPEVLQACWDFAMGCAVRIDNLLDLLASARQYKDHKMTKELMKKMKQHKSEYPDIQLYEETFDVFTSDDSMIYGSPDVVAGET